MESGVPDTEDPKVWIGGGSTQALTCTQKGTAALSGRERAEQLRSLTVGFEHTKAGTRVLTPALQLLSRPPGRDPMLEH